MTRVTVHRFRALIGRVSTMATRSPFFASSFSLCARNVEVRFWIFP